MKKTNKLIAFILILCTVLSFSVSFAGKSLSEMTDDEIKEKLKSWQTTNPFEMTVSEFALDVGDFAMEYLTYLMKEEVTVEKVIFNKVDVLNANFFENMTNAARTKSTDYLRDVINEWYSFLGKIVIIVFLCALVAVGIMTMLRRREWKGASARNFYKMGYRYCDILFFPLLNEICVRN